MRMLMFLMIMLLVIVPVDAWAVFPVSDDPGCNMERICAAWAETAVTKVTARCGLGYNFDCRKTESECAEGLLGGKKHWFLCVCEKKDACLERVCALYETSAVVSAAVNCSRSHCDCSETKEICDTSLLGREKHIFECQCN